MKKTAFFLFVSLLILSCKNPVSSSDLSKINGYWEIEQVTLSDGTKKEYKINENIDFFEIKKDSGFRKKVAPQLDGTYLVNDSEEKIKIEKSADGTYISYKTDYATWKEKIKTLTKEQLILENDQNIQYQYKHPIPFTVK